MSEKAVQKVRDNAAALVGSGETIRHAVPVTSGPALALLLGPLGVAMLKFRVVALTDQALYVMAVKGTGAPKEVEERVPVGSVAVSTDKNPFPSQSTLVLGDRRLNVARPYKDEAERLAAAAGGGA